MLAIDYITHNFMCGLETDSFSQLQHCFSSQKISHLPIVDSANSFLGVLNELDLSNWIERKDISLLLDVKSYDFQHIFECIDLFVSNSLSCLPVTNSANQVIGAINLHQIMRLTAQLAVSDMPGAVVVLEVHATDYSLQQIAQIVETNGAIILALHTSSSAEKQTIRIILKLNTKETSSIMQTFRRYDYAIVSNYNGIDTMDQFYKDRIQELYKFINI